MYTVRQDIYKSKTRVLRLHVFVLLIDLYMLGTLLYTRKGVTHNTYPRTRCV